MQLVKLHSSKQNLVFSAEPNLTSKSNDNPILTNIETVSVQGIPFPAVTINAPRPNVWRHFAKILNGLTFDQVAEELPDDSKLVKKVSPILDQVLEIILESYQPNEEIDQDIIAAFAKIYANYPEEEIDLKIKSDLKKLCNAVASNHKIP